MTVRTCSVITYLRSPILKVTDQLIPVEKPVVPHLMHMYRDMNE